LRWGNYKLKEARGVFVEWEKSLSSTLFEKSTPLCGDISGLFVSGDGEI